MRVESPLVSQSLIEPSKSVEKKEVTDVLSQGNEALDEAQSYLPTAFGFSGTYSIASLKSAVDYHAKFMTVAENNMQAARNTSMIPQAILNHFNG